MERPSAGGGAHKFRHVVKGSHGDHIRIPGEIYSKIWGDSDKPVHVVDPFTKGVFKFYILSTKIGKFMYEAIPGLSEHYGPLVGKTIEFTHARGFKFLLNMMDDGMGENRHELLSDVQKGSGRCGAVIHVSSDSSDNEAEGDGVEAIQGGGHLEVVIRVERESGDNYVGGGVRGWSGRYRFEKTITRAQSRGRQSLPLPRVFVKKFLQPDWEVFDIHPYRSRKYICNLLWRQRKGNNDCHLGRSWYQFVKDNRLKFGDIVLFETVRENFNYAQVTIVRRGEHLNER
ncbi:DNA-binding barrel domain superfamily [Sesbania bispinosa]|nr:DNA-binding barrel domain superfamily [Sesbania bispinosa]